MRQYHSRLQEVEEQRSIKSALIFGGLSILIVALAIIFGIKAFSKFISVFNRPNSSQVSGTSNPIPAPSLSALSPYTNQQSIIVRGQSIPNSTVKIFFNNSSDDAVTDGNGNFSANISLSKGVNTIYAKTVDNSGNLSGSSSSYIVTYTTETPNLTIKTPQNNQIFYGSTQENLDIQGSTDANNTLTINDHIVVVDPSGNFNFNFSLQSGDNTLKVISTDQAGNKKEIDLKVTYSP